MVKIIGIIYKNRNEFGDFNFMINSGEYENCLFIYNDNEENYYNKTCYKGKGNAIIRMYNKYSEYKENPYSAGIPTGSLKYKGYNELNERNKKIIDDCIDDIQEIIKKNNKKTIYYSVNDKNGILGTNLFNVNNTVLEYITYKIFDLSYKKIEIMDNKMNIINKIKRSN